MTWTDFHESIRFTADIASILTFLGLGIIGIRIGQVVQKFGPKRLIARLKKLFELEG